MIHGKKISKALASLTVFTAMAGAADAGHIQFANTGTGAVREGSGGEFTLRVSGGDLAGKDLFADLGYVDGVTANVPGVGFSSTGGYTWGDDDFETFCIERNQHIGLGAIYDYEVGAGAVPGGISGGVPNPDAPGTIDYLSKGTARLYSEFARVEGAFVDPSLYAYSDYGSSGRRKDAEELQWALWFLEGEATFAEANGFDSGGTNSGSQNKFLEYLAFGTYDGSNAIAAADFDSLTVNNTASDPWRVAALNLGTHPTHGKQDQLVLWDEAFQVPDGGLTVLLLGLGLSGLAVVRRFSDRA